MTVNLTEAELLALLKLAERSAKRVNRNTWAPMPEARAITEAIPTLRRAAAEAIAQREADAPF